MASELPFRPDLDAYFRRIGYAGDRTPTVATLSAIVGRHAASIPFENLDVLLKAGIDLELPAIERKLVHARRGGYCFEQNSLLMSVLVALGFQVTPLAARVRVQQPREAIPPRTHMFLSVLIEGVPWLADVGVGSLTPSAALRLDIETPQSTPHETHRIVREDGRFFHQALMNPGHAADEADRRADDWSDVYEFTGEAMPAIDREVANWWTSTNPRAKFSQNLMVALVGPDGTRRGIQNDRFVRRRGATILETTHIASAEQLLALLHVEFGLSFPASTRFGPPGSPWPTS